MKSFIILILLTPGVWAAIPPDVYVDKGACPFECCAYKEWTASMDLDLVDKPYGKKNVGHVKKGTAVQGLTGEVYTVPTRAEVVYDHPSYKTGDVFYLLTYLGEGAYKIMNLQGEVSTETVWVVSCPEPSANCWVNAEVDDEKITARSTWWVQVRTAEGLTGWVESYGNFDHQGTCE